MALEIIYVTLGVSISPNSGNRDQICIFSTNRAINLKTHNYTNMQMCPADSYRTSYTCHMVNLALENQLACSMCVLYRRSIFCIYIFDVEIEETIYTVSG